MASADDIRKYAASNGYGPNAAGQFEVPDDNAAHRIYSHAASQSYTGADLDGAFGWNPGTSDKWTAANGLKALSAPPVPPAAKPATAPTVAPPATAPAPAVVPSAASAPVESIMQRVSKAAAGTVGAAPTPAPPGPGAQYKGVASSAGQGAQTAWNEDMSSAGRLNSMISSGSPLMQSAQTRGNQAAARRGLMGSSMGIEAAQKAMIDSAAPFATTDAGLYAQGARSNTEQANAWNARDLDRQQSDAQFGAKLGSDESQFGRTLMENARQANLGSNTQLTIAGMNYDMDDRRLSQDDKQFMQGLGMEAKRLDVAIEQFAKEFGLSVEQLAVEKGKLSQQDRQFYEGLTLDKDKIAKQASQFYDGLALDKDKLAQQGRQFDTAEANRFSLEAMAAANRIDLANIDAANRKDLVAAEAKYKADIAGNENIANAWGSTMSQIGTIQNNPELDAAAKSTLIDNTVGGFNAFTEFWKKAGGGSVDVSDLLAFGPAVNKARPTPAVVDNSAYPVDTGQ